jgi:hypothetical protein
MEAGRLVTLLSWVPTLSGPTVKGGLLGGGLSNALRLGLRCCGAWSPSLDRDLDPLTEVKWVGLVCAWGTDEACVSGYPVGLQ